MISVSLESLMKRISHIHQLDDFLDDPSEQVIIKRLEILDNFIFPDYTDLHERAAIAISWVRSSLEDRLEKCRRDSLRRLTREFRVSRT